ncbi:hypothetical protein JTB14_002082 [Gonioctena quinquepunctata]|nr:hypothetical protein JTB14_032290 [Gonioctena quinquepunctata]KAG5869278.1 hypothetical protein JTB14_002082 [Gonioctena quinquepunctata]
MSRGRKRKSQKGLFLEEDMKRAVRQVLIGEGGVKLSLRKAATDNGISFQTLRRYVEKEKANPNIEISMKSNYKHRDISSDEDSGEEEREISLHDDLDEDEWIPEVASSSLEELNRDPEPTDFVLVQFKAKKDVFYIGKVVELKKESNDVKINFLRKSSKVDGYFIFPAILDIAVVSIDDIKIILPTPSLLGNTKRLQSYYKFDINFSQLNMC